MTTALFTNVIQNEVAYGNAIKRNILRNAYKTWSANTERADEIEVALNKGRKLNEYGDLCGYEDNFMGSMASAFDAYGKLTPKQCEAVLKGIDALAARKAEWADKEAAQNALRAHVGVVGEKLTLTLTVKHIAPIETRFGTNFIHICEDDKNNTIIYKGNASGFPLKGETATLIVTVKEHGYRDGVKQTIIQRPKII
jgi:hypothetical protein